MSSDKLLIFEILLLIEAMVWIMDHHLICKTSLTFNKFQIMFFFTARKVLAKHHLKVTYRISILLFVYMFTIFNQDL